MFFGRDLSTCLSRGMAAVLVVLGTAPAQALIPAGGAGAGLEGKAPGQAPHDPFVVGLAVEFAKSGGGAGTGVFLGYDAAKATGFILTAGHAVNPGSQPAKGDALKRVTLCFGPDMGKDSKAPRVDATRAIIHPDMEHYTHRFTTGPGRGLPETPMTRHDLAILVFDARSCREALDQAGVKAAELYDGEGYKKPHIKARMVGFGGTGSNDSMKLTYDDRARSGFTTVTYGEWRGWTGFRHVAMPTMACYHAWRAARGSLDPAVNLGQFQPVAKETAYLAPDFKTRFTVLSHEQQAMAAPGDSGGPLIFQSKGDKVAGIYSRIKIDLCTLPGGDGRLAQMLLMTFEPVKDHLPWIRAVQAGELGKSRVVDLAEEADLPAGAEAAPAASAGTAVEKKAA